MSDFPTPARTTRGLRIHVVLIHHQDEQRVDAAKKTVRAVTEAVSAIGEAQFREVYYQPPPHRVPAKELARRRLRQWHIERNWAEYLGVSRRWLLSSGLLSLRMAALMHPRVRANASRQAFIELALSAKHELAWRNALEDRADLLIVLEDDARATKASIKRIQELLDVAMSERRLNRTFIDLAGGVTWGELRYEGITRRRDNGVLSLTRLATNTACAYAIGADLLEDLVALTITQPKTRSVPADWLINLSFMTMAEQKRALTLCLHSEPHALDHGSFTGAVTSSIRS